MELRKDYVLDRYVIIVPGRNNRPQELQAKQISSNKTCFFCPGNEHLTPPEIGRLGSINWTMRWFANKFPAVEPIGESTLRTDNTYFTFANAYGRHEIIAETSKKNLQLWDLSKKDVVQLLGVYKDRSAALMSDECINYVSIFKNHGAEAGASLEHSHTQIIATSIVPRLIKEEIDASVSECNYCKIIAVEKDSFRRCFENASAVAFAPYASRFNYEIWIFPKSHAKSFSEISQSTLEDIGELLHSTLGRLKNLNVSYNYFIHQSPKEAELHFHIEVTPRIATWAGFELSSGMVLNTVSPEDAARFYRFESDY